MAVARPEEDRAAGDHGTGQKDVEGVGNRLAEGLHSVEALGLEASLAGGGELPFQRARLRVQRVDLVVLGK